MSLLNEELVYAMDHGLSWFDICEREQTKVDQGFINMTEKQWIAYTRTITDINDYVELNRIEMLRRKHAQDVKDYYVTIMTEAEWIEFCDCLTKLGCTNELKYYETVRNPKPVEHSKLYWYTEYSLYPMTYFTNEEEQEAELSAIEEEVKNTKGIWRFGAIKLEKQEKNVY